jgi:four helix bundle protein
MRNYRDLQVWGKAHSLTLAAYRGTQGFPEEERFGLTSPIRRSATSVPANLKPRAASQERHLRNLLPA